MMDDHMNCPTDETWRAWLGVEGEIAVCQDRLTKHLDRCNRCQQVVKQLSLDDPFYRQSREALRSTGLTSHDWHVACVSDTETLTTQPSSPAIVSLVQTLLGPSDDERSLGRLGRFEVLGIVGSGGMGIVLKARSIDMDRVVAIKIPQPQYWQSPDTLTTLEREARSAAAVVHPNVISIYHVDRYRDVPYLVMPYLAGQSLEQRIRDAGPMPIAEALRIARQVASALAAAHACGVVHRDVKPANILLGSGTERVVLSDFGLAKVQSDATCTATGTFAGTPIYLSPEQASGCGAGPAGDIYSLGTVLWTMLAGMPPMSGMHTHAIVRRIAESKLPVLPEHCADLPSWARRLIATMHADVPSDRPSAEQLTRWIERCQRHLSDRGSTPIPEELAVPTKSLHRVFNWSMIALAAAVLSAAGWMMFGRSETKPTPRQAVTTNVVDALPQQKDPKPDPITSDPITPPDKAKTEPPDETDLYLGELQAELDQLNNDSLPNWESKMQELLDESP